VLGAGVGEALKELVGQFQADQPADASMTAA